MPAAKYSAQDVYIAVLTGENLPLLSSFKSENAELNEYLQKDALPYQKIHLGVTYVLFSKEGNKPISYVSVAMGSLRIPDEKEFVLKGKKLRDYPKDFPRQFPALLIGKLATDESEVGKGGAGLLLDFIVKLALKTRAEMGCSHLIAHAKPKQSTIDWYKHKGFVTDISDWKDRETVPMYFELP